MSVMEYESKFESLSRFEKGLDNDPEENICLFLKGLKLSIREKVYHLSHISVAEAVTIAMEVEHERADNNKFLEKKRGTEGNKSSGLGKRSKSDSGSSRGSMGKDRFSGFGTDGQGPRKRICFGCGQPRHIRRDCPKISQQLSQSFSAARVVARVRVDPVEVEVRTLEPVVRLRVKCMR